MAEECCYPIRNKMHDVSNWQNYLVESCILCLPAIGIGEMFVDADIEEKLALWSRECC
jgi:hypothetical protein